MRQQVVVVGEAGLAVAVGEAGLVVVVSGGGRPARDHPLPPGEWIPL